MSNIVNYQYKKLPTKRWGLQHEFTLYPYFDDNADWTNLCEHCKPLDSTHAFSESNRIELAKYVEPWMRSIVEIGVSRDGYEFSSTKVLLENKHEDCRYLGIDIEDRSWIVEKASNVSFIQNSSWSVMDNMPRIIENGPWIDLLLIDGDHSVNSVLKEWDYAKIIRPNGGVIVLHDTNFHPGPWCLIENIDTSLFEATKLCVNETDWGLAVLRRL